MENSIFTQRIPSLFPHTKNVVDTGESSYILLNLCFMERILWKIFRKITEPQIKQNT